MARSRRKKKKGRAVGLLMLAGLTLLIAGFIARREIPMLIKNAGHSPASRVHPDNGEPQSLIGGGEKPHRAADARLYAGGIGSARKERVASPGANGSRAGAQKNESGEHLSGSDRRQLDDLIRQKAR